MMCKLSSKEHYKYPKKLTYKYFKISQKAAFSEKKRKRIEREGIQK